MFVDEMIDSCNLSDLINTKKVNFDSKIENKDLDEEELDFENILITYLLNNKEFEPVRSDNKINYEFDFKENNKYLDKNKLNEKEIRVSEKNLDKINNFLNKIELKEKNNILNSLKEEDFNLINLESKEKKILFPINSNKNFFKKINNLNDLSLDKESVGHSLEKGSFLDRINFLVKSKNIESLEFELEKNSNIEIDNFIEKNHEIKNLLSKLNFIKKKSLINDELRKELDNFNKKEMNKNILKELKIITGEEYLKSFKKNIDENLFSDSRLKLIEDEKKINEEIHIKPLKDTFILNEKNFNINEFRIQKNIYPIIKDNLIKLISNGGGVVSLKLKPDFLGDILLRVKIIGNKLEIKIQTKNSISKKILESGLSSLKEMISDKDPSIKDAKIDIFSIEENKFNHFLKKDEFFDIFTMNKSNYELGSNLEDSSSSLFYKEHIDQEKNKKIKKNSNDFLIGKNLNIFYDKNMKKLDLRV